MTASQSAELRARVAEARAANLAKADQVRSYRAELKGRLKAGEVTFRDVITAQGNVRLDLIRTMPVKAILENLPDYGPAKARKLRLKAGVSAEARIDDLTARQAFRLLELVEPCPTCGRMRA